MSPLDSKDINSVNPKGNQPYFVPLIYISVFVLVPYCLDDCGFVVEPEVRQVDSSSSVLLSQDCFGYSRFFCISIQIVKLFVLVL